jgi:hypothetical protein
MTGTPLAGRLPETLRTVLDRASAVLMLRLSLAVIFVWFGALKPLGPSPAVPLVSNAVSPLDAVRYFLPYDLFFPLGVVGGDRRGLSSLPANDPTRGGYDDPTDALDDLRPVLIPGMTFAAFPLVPSMAGIYIVKDFVSLGGGLVVASGVEEGRES